MECVQCSTVVDNGNKTSELPNGAWVGWLDWTGGRAGAHAWEQSVRSAVLSGSHRTSRTPLHSNASFKTSFELDYSYVSFPKMKRLCTGSKTGGICYEHAVLWIGRRRLLRQNELFCSRTTRYSRDHSCKRSYAPPHQLILSRVKILCTILYSLSYVPFIRFWFSFFYMNNIKSQNWRFFEFVKGYFVSFKNL